MSAFGTERFRAKERPSSGAGAQTLLERLVGALVDRYVVPKLYRVHYIDLPAGGAFKLDTGDQMLTLVYVSVYKGTLDLYEGERGSPGGNSIPLTRVTPTGFPVPFALPPDAYKFTAHAAGNEALRACVILTSA